MLSSIISRRMQIKKKKKKKILNTINENLKLSEFDYESDE